MDKEKNSTDKAYLHTPPGPAETVYCLDRERQTIRVDGRLYTAEDIRRRINEQANIFPPAATEEGHDAEPVSSLARPKAPEDAAPPSSEGAGPEPAAASPPEAPALLSFRRELDLFLAEWFDDSPFLTVQTSGSTGTPKQLTVRKTQMMESARLTCRFLHLRPQDKALLCMPLRYIAGKMMVVRALVAGLDLVLQPPSGHPLAEIETPLRFAAMIPLQVYNTLREPEEAARLRAIGCLIIGGGAVDTALETALRDFPGAVYSTYGMTETLSHIALRRLSGPKASRYYEPFDTVGLSLSADHTLIIDAPLVSDERLSTHDVAELLPDGRFTILGRKDNIINSGGIKIQIESVENELRPLISVNFALTSVPHPKFGEAAVLLVEGPETLAASLRETIGRKLPKYRQPKYILAVDRIPHTGNSKISRAECRRLATDRIFIKQ